MDDFGSPFDFVVVGAQKAGSTALAAALGGHPDLVCPAFEVPEFADPFFDDATAGRLLRLRAQFGAESKRFGIKDPSYLGDTKCLDRIAALNPESRLFVSLRDPVERAYSATKWYMAKGLMPVGDPSEALIGLVERAADSDPHEILRFGQYSTLLEAVPEPLKAHMVVVGTSDLEGDMSKVSELVSASLGVEGVVRKPGSGSGSTPSSIAGLRAERYRSSLAVSSSRRRSAISDPRWERPITLPIRAIARPLVRSIDRQGTPLELTPQARRELSIFYRADIEYCRDSLDVGAGAWDSDD